VLVWYVGLTLAALFLHLSMTNNSAALSSAFAAAAVVIPLTLLGYTMRSYGDTFNSHVLVPAIGPIVIAVLIFEYVEYNKRVDDAYAAQLIPADLVLLSDVKWTRGAADGTATVAGHVINRSPHQLVGLSVELVVYGGSEKLASATTDAKLDVGPGQQANFTTVTPEFPAAGLRDLPCIRQEALPPPIRKGKAGLFECFYRVAGTRGEQVFF